MNPETAAQQRQLAFQNAFLGLERLSSQDLALDGRGGGILYELQRRIATIEAAETEGQQQPTGTTEEQIAAVMQEMQARALGRL